MSQLDVYEFGRRLIETNDLDPVYVLLWDVKLVRPKLKQWLLAYWCYYHIGTASYITSADDYEDYWNRMRQAAASKEYPRSAERRHFRGNLSIKSVGWLEGVGIPKLFAPFNRSLPIPASAIIKEVKTWYGFGDWIAFKVADMLERLGFCKVSFDQATAFLFDSPREGASELYRQEESGRPLSPSETNDWAVQRILGRLGDRYAPPDYSRPLNIQEVETILCKWKSYLGGHYEIGEDIEACHKALLRFPDCEISERILDAGRREFGWEI